MPVSQSSGEQRRRTAVLLQTHFLDRSLLRLFDQIRRDLPDGYEAFVVMHVPAGTPRPALLLNVPHHFVTTPEIRNPDYAVKTGGPEWKIWRGGHPDLITLHFYNAHPEYDRYWSIEYDVRFSGAWCDLFTAFDNDEADFLTATLRTEAADPGWMHWPTLHVPPRAGGLATQDKIACFMPIFRVSRQALAAVDRAYRQGWGGHCEVAWPTIIHRVGLTLRDFGGDGAFVRDGDRNRFYTNNLFDRDLAPGSLVFRPVRIMVGFRRNRLYHPVKPLRYKLREEARHIWITIKPHLWWLHKDEPLETASAARYWPEEARRGPSRRLS